MGKNTSIEWTATYHADGTITPGHSWNPWQGCHKVSEGCKNCYMFRDKKRWGQDPTTVVRSKPATFNAPLCWKEPARVFVCSWSDFFIEEADEWRDDAREIMARTPHLTYLLLTKRERSLRYWRPLTAWKNTWIGVSVESAKETTRIEYLRQAVARVKFLSLEPLLGPLQNLDLTSISWVICGGESGPNARPMAADWIRDIRDQCREAGVAFFMKQMSKKAPIPDDLMIREFPSVTKEDRNG